MGLVTATLIVLGLTWLFKYIFSRAKFVYDRMSAIQGPSALPIIGNFHQFHFRPEEFFEQAQGLSYMLKEGDDRVTRVWLGGLPFVLLYGAEECEAVLGSNKMLNKPFLYGFLSPWIGEGLLISKPDKWRPRRKLLTPTFHYDILKDFVEVYNRHGTTLLNKMMEMTESKEYQDIFHTISLCTLDVICEAALGTCIEAQHKPDSPYLDAVFRMKEIVFQRFLNPLYYVDFFFNRFGPGKEHDQYVKVLHDFTSKAINARREKVEAAGGVQQLLAQETAEGRRRMAFLDLMLEMNAKGELPMEGLQEEVDTFTFEGHDTTSAAMNWFLHLMGNNSDIQARVQKEIDDVLGEADRPITYEDLGELRYLEACIKETLRLYPSVPLIARQCVEDIKIKKHVLPAGTGVVVIPSMVHKDPRYWEDPEVFNPERFYNGGDLKHAYAYIPFSAGSRNCIGQRFAIMEEKCILALLLKNLKVKAKLRTDEMRVAAELIIRPMYGNELIFRRRTFGDYSPCVL
ncbi:unnamed protein product [Caenorhabditis auriculariae]|uniref:Uncharacterized protein n=1 Tax=Caenorhabditis auriculariae TaxID=2777116 RepID=A0A8S1H9Y9_9PELO|nr:unnamed protein product [Caenorhabditis auriculariae]